MSTKRRTAPVMRVLAVLLILASAAMFLMPWMSLSLTVGGETISLNSQLEKAAAETNSTPEQMVNELCDQLGGELDDLTEKASVSLNKDGLLSTVRTLLKGAWSPKDLLSMVGNVRSAVKELKAAISPQLMMVMDSSTRALIDQAGEKIDLAFYILLGLMGLCALLGLVALICAIAGRKGGVLPYLIAVLIMLALFVLLVTAGNQNMAELEKSLNLDLGADGLSLKLEFWGMISAGFAVLAFVFMCIRGKAGETQKSGGGTWKCPTCGGIRKQSDKFCLKCGTKQPLQGGPAPAPVPIDGWKCPTCGTILKNSQVFCLNCGTRRPGDQPMPEPRNRFGAQDRSSASMQTQVLTPADRPVPVPPPASVPVPPPASVPVPPPVSAPVPPPAPAPVSRRRAEKGWKCPTCGTKLGDAQRFCLNCGTKRPEGAPAPAPAPGRRPAGGWICPSCGTKLGDEQRFCLNCGTKRPEGAPAPAPTPAPAPQRRPAGGWICPSCGTKLGDEQRFCLNCGTKRPDAAPAETPQRPAGSGWTCPGCGTKLSDAQRFCLNCGTQRPVASPPAEVPTPEPGPRISLAKGAEEAPAPSPVFSPAEPPAPAKPVVLAKPEPAPAPAPEEVICPSCGYRLGEGMFFCPKCGTKVLNGDDTPRFGKHAKPEPAPEEASIAAAPDYPTEDWDKSVVAPRRTPPPEENRTGAAPLGELGLEEDDDRTMAAPRRVKPFEDQGIHAAAFRMDDDFAPSVPENPPAQPVDPDATLTDRPLAPGGFHSAGDEDL